MRKTSQKPEARSQKLRRANLRDCTFLVSIERFCFPACDRFSYRTWRHLLCSSSAITIVSQSGDQITGAIVGLIRKNSGMLRIYSIAVGPTARGNGLGMRLIYELLARAPRRCRRIVLEVREKNIARSLYRKLGMHPVRALPAYYPDGADGVRYEAETSTLRSEIRSYLKER